jgi:hypothetical protein
VPRTWLAIRVELVEGRGETFWPRPGRVFAVSRSHTFGQLAVAIDDAFARWDRAHLMQFALADGTRLAWPDPFGEDGEALNAARTRLSRVSPGDQFLYEFDFGDGWAHLCTVDAERIDPIEYFGAAPEGPQPIWGWGCMPDQYGRSWADDDGEGRPPPDPGLEDLPPLAPGWGPR